jgi:UDP-N-acetylmuramoyl-L-alanyl-D-glutamate--2,6-diaminopimelate ligase
MIYLDELLKDVAIVASSDDLHVEVTGVQADSRKIKPKNCFVAIPGFKVSGLTYVGDAIANGASCVIFETNPEDTLPEIPFVVTWIQVVNARVALSKLAAAFYGYKRISPSLYVVGVTGTNGKTTITSLIQAIFSREHPTAKIGTLGMFFEESATKTTLTTPEATEIFEFLSRVHEQGCSHVVMEVSSVALKLHRVGDLRFSQGIFTNFSGDHLDFHKSMEDYLGSKLMLFRQLTMEDWAVVNIDDPSALKIIEQLNCKYLTYGFCEDADVRPLRYKLSLEGVQATLATPRGNITIKSILLGRLNLVNIMAAVASAVIRGIALENIAAAVREFKPVRGRLDLVYRSPFSVLIDYAHTDNALETLLQSLKEIVSHKIILVFGAGGSRDKTKRPRMGKAASRFADSIIVTSDNPRNEEPMNIINDIIQGFEPGFKNFLVEVDRKKAIEKALHLAAPGDLVVVAGKGHEDYQIFKDKTLHFDDYEVVGEALSGLARGKDAGIND